MAELTTKTLSEVDTITEMGSTDYVLVESNGTMKKISGSEVGGGVCVVDMTQYTADDSGEFS